MNPIIIPLSIIAASLALIAVSLSVICWEVRHAPLKISKLRDESEAER